MGNIFLIQGDDDPVELSEQRYDSEDVLQGLLVKCPGVLAGGQADDAAPRRWLLIKREMGIPDEEEGTDRWAVDHLFLDQDGIPTLVEVKRSTDTRIRREVVGQMLDYAANAVVYWPVEQLREEFRKNCESGGKVPEEVLFHFLGNGMDEEQFWQSVKTNLQAKRLRLIFVADVIPSELRRIVEFLNEQMDPAEVLAIEVRQFVGDGTARTLVPVVFGQTAEADTRKGGPRQTRQWDEASFLAQLKETRGEAEWKVGKRLYEYLKPLANWTFWGRGSQRGSVYPMFSDKDGQGYLIGLWTSGRVEFPLGWMLRATAPFTEEDARQELLDRLNKIPGVAIAQEQINKWPFIRLAVLQSEEAFQGTVQVLD